MVVAILTTIGERRWRSRLTEWVDHQEDRSIRMLGFAVRNPIESIVMNVLSIRYMLPSTSGLSRRPFTAESGVRIPLGVPYGLLVKWLRRWILIPEAGVQFSYRLPSIWGVSLLEKRATYNRLTAGALPPRPTICPSNSDG